MSNNYDVLLKEYFQSGNKTPKEHAEDIWKYAGFRRAGSKGDKKAAEIISRKFKELGADDVIVEEFLGKSKSPPVSLVILFILYSISFVIFMFSIFGERYYNYNSVIEFLIALLGLLVFAFSVVYIILDRKKAKDLLGFLFKNKKMYNVIAKIKPKKETKKILIISGHHDAPWNGKLFEKKDKNGNPNFYGTYVFFNDGTEKVLIFCALTILVYQIILLVNLFINFIWIFYIKMIFVGILGFTWLWLATFTYLIIPRGVSPGANDNLAAICVIITTLGIIAKNRPDYVEIWGLSLTGEETNHQGAKYFIEKHYDEIKDAYDINMESVGGSSKIRQLFFAADGEKPKKAKFPKELIDLLLEGMKKSGISNISTTTETLPIGGSDAAIFANNGIKAILMGAVQETKEFSGNYHNPEDTVENLDENIMESAVKILLSTINILNKKLN
ncbi:MAG: M28 family metallopeptidase [Promethearchaeota archaeon]